MNRPLLMMCMPGNMRYARALTSPCRAQKRNCTSVGLKLNVEPWVDNSDLVLSYAQKSKSGLLRPLLLIFLWIGILFWFGPVGSYGHTQRDSLKTVAESTLHDTLRIKAILEITVDLEAEEESKFITLGRTLANKGIDKDDADQAFYLRALDKLCVDEAWAHDRLFDQSAVALEMMRSCLRAWRSEKDRELMAQALNNIGVLHYYLGSLDSSMYFLSRALEMRRTLPNRSDFASGLVNMGYLTYRSGLIAPSMPYFLEAIDVTEQAGDDDGLLNALRMLGTVYVDLNEYEKLLDLARRRLQISYRLDIPEEVGSSLNGMAIALDRLQRKDSAAYFYERCIDQIPLLKQNKQSMALQWLCNYATFKQSNGQLEEALAIIEEANAMNDGSDNFELIARVAEVKSIIFNKMQLPDSAIFYGDILMAEAERTGRWDLLEIAAENLQMAYAQKKNFERAYHYLGIARQYGDSLFNKENTRQLERAGLMHQFNKKEAERAVEQSRLDALAAAELRHHRTVKNVSIAIGVLVLLLAFGLYRRYRFKQRVATELEAKNVEVEAARERAERSEAFRKQFLANMSHEIRTPMNAIIGITRLLRDRERDEESTRYLNAVGHAANNLLVVINDILDLSKLEAGKMEARLHPAPLLLELDMLATTFYQRAREKGLHFKLHTSDDLPPYVHTDMARIIQVLYNLLGNAIKFTDVGEVMLLVKSAPIERSKVRLSFAVKDTGPGIAPDEQLRIFESFGQGHAQDNRRYSGTGLGLTIARSLVELLNGTLELESTPGEGATFSFSIVCNLSNEEAYQMYHTQHNFSLSERHQSYPLRILVADDNEYNRLVATDTLLKYFHHVQIDTAATGHEVLSGLTQKDYDLVLMDVQMPGMDGYAATQAIRAHQDEPIRNIHIVAFTASVIRTDIQRCYDAGMNGYIAKPFRDEDLLRPVAALIDTLPDRTLPEQHLPGAKTDPNSSTAAGLNAEYNAKTALFLQLVPKRLEKLKQAIERDDVDKVKRAVHLMKAQLLDGGMTGYSEDFEWFEYLDTQKPKPKWKSKAKKLARAIHKELNRHKSIYENGH